MNYINKRSEVIFNKKNLFIAYVLLASLILIGMTVKPKKIIVLIAGDSIVQTYVGEQAKTQQGWGQRIGELFNDDVTIKNYAVSGKSTKTFMENWKTLSKDIQEGTFVLIQFGHNDSHKSSRPEATDAWKDYKDNLIFYSNDVKRKGGIPILVTPPYRRNFDTNGKLLPYISNETVGPSNLEPYAKAMREVAKEENVFLVDLFEKSGNLLQSLGNEGSLPLFCKPSDQAHFSPYGAKLMAKIIVEELVIKECPLANYICN